MKKLLIVLACLAATLMVRGQGTMDVGNMTTGPNGSVDAPIYDLVVGGTKLAGSGYLAQVYAGPTAGSLTAVMATPAPFYSAASGGAGYYNPGANYLLPVTGVAAGGTAFVQVVAWEAAAGTFVQAQASSTFKWGQSSTFSIALGGSGSPPSLPSAMVGLTSFAIAAHVVPEPSTMALGLLGAATLLLRRRK